MTTELERLTLLGFILARRVAPFVLKILHYYRGSPMPREDLLATLCSKIEQHGLSRPSKAQMEDDLALLSRKNLIVEIEGQLSLTEEGKEVAVELFR